MHVMDKTIFRITGAAIAGALALAATSVDQTSRLIIGMLIGIPSLVLMVMSRRQLGKSFSVTPQAKALVTTGIYSKIQHPLYLFLDLLLLAVIVGLGWSLFLIAWGILVIAQVRQARREEKVLADAFGADYEAYRMRTWF